MRKRLIGLISILLLSLVATSQARILYIDATQGEAGNTRLATGEVWKAAPLTQGNDGSGDDGLWRERAFGNTSIFEASGDYRNAPYDQENCPRLVTSADVPQGDYEVYVYFWDTNSSWNLRASLTDDAGELPLFVPNRAGDPNNPAGAADVNDFDAPVPLVTTSGNRIMWQVYLGTVKATKTIHVYVDDNAGTGDSNKRTWYDGIGIKALPPKIVYVDATEGDKGNTALAAGGVFKSTADGSGADNLWRGRAFGNGATIFESGGAYGDTANPEDCPRLVTTVAVPENEYEVFAYFWSDAGTWRIQAALADAAGDLPLFVANDPNSAAKKADPNTFAVPVPMLTEANRTLWQVRLGTTGRTASISVFIDDVAKHGTHNARTWYDGIGYKVITPVHYVDATQGATGNTKLATGEVWTAAPLTQGNDGSGDDGLWRERAFGNTSIFEAGGDYRNKPYDMENCPRLVTSVAVPENIYEVFAYFWDTASTWNLRASLSNDVNELPLFLPQTKDPNSLAVMANAADFAVPVPLVTTAGNRIMWQVPLGRTAMTTKIDVYVDDNAGTGDSNKRTWYDGIGYRVASLYTPDAVPVVKPEEPKPEEPKPEEPKPEEPLPAGVDPGTAGLVAYYSFEGNANDLSGNGLNGTIGGAPTYVAGLAGYGQTMDFHAKPDAAGTAGAAGDYVDCGNSPLLGFTDAMTVGAWVNIRSIPDEWRAIVTKGDSAWRLASNAATKGFQFAFSGSGRGYLAANTTKLVEFNEWHYVCGTYSKTNGACIYLDGRLDGTNADKNGIDVDPYNVWIGANSEPMSYKPGRYFDGLIDEVRLYNRALSQAEVVFLATKK